ncbi:MAG: hypothetical protein KKF46_08765 [Nanoarchaeota archaeon]|nr:hypothetical protein [Nanoarchaeota archaeon]MBU1322422.1 hypothetical protein [Nanoarchaeota archaeon]MBU1598171.1 hypothetical protein [Nanoarchaeota archaeon]MBU2441422.1 hypothetical protein [Nanoarchaeota archaeon]
MRQTKSKKSKKAQVWLSDYTISLLLFTIAAVLAVKLILNGFNLNADFQELKTDASQMSEILLSEGYPVQWTNNTVIRPGLLIGSRLNSTKILNAMNVSYSSLKTKLQSRHDFLITFEDAEGDMLEFDGRCAIGNSDVTINSTGPPFDCHNPDFTSINYNNLVKVSRLAIYDSEIVRMVVYTWR